MHTQQKIDNQKINRGLITTLINTINFHLATWCTVSCNLTSRLMHVKPKVFLKLLKDLKNFVLLYLRTIIYNLRRKICKRHVMRWIMCISYIFCVWVNMPETMWMLCSVSRHFSCFISDVAGKSLGIRITEQSSLLQPNYRFLCAVTAENVSKPLEENWKLNYHECIKYIVIPPEQY